MSDRLLLQLDWFVGGIGRVPAWIVLSSWQQHDDELSFRPLLPD
jgi:hypothetical protein